MRGHGTIRCEMILAVPPTSPPSVDSAAAIEARRDVTNSRLWTFHDEYVLGTRLEVLVNSHSGALAKQAALAARKEIDRLNRVFNHRLAESELSWLNRTRSVKSSIELFAVV